MKRLSIWKLCVYLSVFHSFHTRREFILNTYYSFWWYQEECAKECANIPFVLLSHSSFCLLENNPPVGNFIVLHLFKLILLKGSCPLLVCLSNLFYIFILYELYWGSKDKRCEACITLERRGLKGVEKYENSSIGFCPLEWWAECDQEWGTLVITSTSEPEGAVSVSLGL